MNADAKPVVGCYDDHPIVLDGVCRILELSGGYSVEARGQCVDDMLRDLHHVQPDILFLDYAMPGDVVAAIRDISGTAQPPHIVVFTANGDSEIALRCLEAGARGFLVKDSLGDELLEAARRVMEGSIHISARHAGRIMLDLGNRAKRASKRDTPNLSPRERQILERVGRALPNKEIGYELGISEKTVKNYMSTLMEKLGARNRVEVAMLAAQVDQTGSASSS